MGLLVEAGGSSLITSSDGGGSWSKLSQPASDATLHAMTFDGAGNGWIVGSDVVMRTLDGGLSWQMRHASGELIAVAADTASNTVWVGGAVNDTPAIQRSQDGGVTWTAAALPPIAGPWVNSLAFADAKHGWALGNTAILRTGDGGLTWARQPRPAVRQLMQITCAGQDRAWAVGESEEGGSLILATVDGGAHWKVQFDRGAKGAVLTDVTFVDASHGWAVGFRGELLATMDGGAHWRSRPIAVRGRRPTLLTVAFSDRQHGWATTGGYLLGTEDGGRHWQSLDIPGGDFQMVTVTGAKTGG